MVATRYEGSDDADLRVIRPRFAADWPQTVRFFAGLSAITLGIALAFAALGYWPILPFAGLELAALGAALYVSARRSLDVQVLRLDGDSLRVEKGRRWPRDRWEFQRAWVEVVVEPAPGRWQACRVFIRSRGRSVEVGEFLDSDARRGLARELRAWIGPMGRPGDDDDRQRAGR